MVRRATLGRTSRGKSCSRHRGVTVRAPPLAQMLALKVSAWRDDVDMSDAEVILRAMTGRREDVWAALTPYLSRGEELKAHYAFDQLWEEIHGKPT